MLRALLHEPGASRIFDGGVELLDRWEGSEDSLLWVVVNDEPADRETALLCERLGIHPLAVADALRDRHPPKVEAFADHTFILLKGLDASTTSLEFGTIQLSIFVGKRILVTRSAGRSISTERMIEALLQGQIPPDVPRAALALRLCRTVADRFLPVLLSVETRLEEMEQEMLTKPSDTLLTELIRQKGDLKQILRVVQYHAQVFAVASTTTPDELAGHVHELTDVREQLDRQLSLARLYYELTDDLMNGYLSLSAHHLNQIMKTLTIVTVIFVPITFMAGIYGMNFEFMPELGFRPAYFMLLGAMLTVVFGILLFFRRRGWIGRAPKRR
jgi:magnesium transporter